MAARIALVTGASRGIGEAIARRLAQDGFDIALNDLPSQVPALEKLHQDLIASGRRSYIHVADVSKEAEVAKMIDDTIKNLGGLDVMVANAGIARMEFVETLGSVDTWDQTMSVNARGVFLCYKYAAEAMITQGRGGRIIGAASIVSKQGMPFVAAYSASKFAVRGLTQSAACELGKHGITVNAYAPGLTETPILKTMGVDEAGLEAIRAAETKRAPVGRIGKPEDIAQVVSFLASEKSDYITGQTISVNGGQIFD